MFPLLRFLILFTLLAPTVTAQEVGQTMRQWWVECDRLGFCVSDINGFTADYEPLTVRLQRSEEPNSPVLILLTPETLITSGDAVIFDFLDGSEPILRKTDTALYNTITLSEPVDSPLLAALMAGSTLDITIGFQGTRGAQTFKVSLDGAIDTLTIMDVAQQRLGRVDAIVARGAAPADSPSDIYPSLGAETGGEDMGADEGGEIIQDSGDGHMEEGPNGSYLDLIYSQDELPPEVVRYAAEDADCGDLTAPLNEMGAVVHRDQTARITYLVPCVIGQANVAYYVVTHDPAKGSDYALQRFELPPAQNKPDRVTILNPQWQADQNQLIATRFGDVNLNCGAYEIHNWIVAEQRFELVSYQHKKNCDGPQMMPSDFPMEWSIGEMGD
nr:DUF1176 domain-containing protein [Amylibacter sp.]